MFCPRCGSNKFWVKDGLEVYCNNPGYKDDYLSHCFYHPSISQQQKILREVFNIDVHLLNVQRAPQRAYYKKWRLEHLEQQKLRVKVWAWVKKTNLPEQLIKPICIKYKRLTKEIVFSELKKNKDTSQNEFCIL